MKEIFERLLQDERIKMTDDDYIQPPANKTYAVKLKIRQPCAFCGANTEKTKNLLERAGSIIQQRFHDSSTGKEKDLYGNWLVDYSEMLGSKK